LLYGFNVKVVWWRLDFLIFRAWVATTVAFVKLVHSSTCLCVFGGEVVWFVCSFACWPFCCMVSMWKRHGGMLFFCLFATWLEETIIVFIELVHSLICCSFFSAFCVIWFVWSCNWGCGVFSFFFVWSVTNAFVDLLLFFCGLFVSYYVVVNSLMLWSLYVGATNEWLVGVVVWWFDGGY
jgi:hypothetical protein